MEQKEYISKGICIWCGKEKPEVSFFTKPHIIPESLGGTEIGFDVCDDCNNYFGTAHGGLPNTNLIFKEIFSEIRAFSRTSDKETWKRLSSAYFNYRYKENKIELKKTFRISTMTNCFKRSLYEVFLQKYHYTTRCGLDKQFDEVRSFARFNKGELRVYYAFNTVILSSDDPSFLSMLNGLIEDIDKYGFFHFWLMGHSFLLEVIPSRARLTDSTYLHNQANKLLIPATGEEKIFELKDIRQIDIFMQRFVNKNIDVRNNLK